jgi:hypothetical protein
MMAMMMAMVTMMAMVVVMVEHAPLQLTRVELIRSIIRNKPAYF